jgi:hypothetical protein
MPVPVLLVVLLGLASNGSDCAASKLILLDFVCPFFLRSEVEEEEREKRGKRESNE